MKSLILAVHRVPTGVSLQDFNVQSDRVTLGRGAGCDWVLVDPQRLLSKRHCEIVRQQARWMVTDLSSNGMTVNGRLLPPGVPCELRDGDRIGFGSYEIDAKLVEAANPSGDEATLGGKAAGGRYPPKPMTQNRETTFESVFEQEAGPGAFFDLTGSGIRSDKPRTLSIVNPFDIALGEIETPPVPRTKGDSFTPSDAVSDLEASFTPPRPTSLLLPDDWEVPLSEGPPASERQSSAPTEPGALPPHPALDPTLPSGPLPAAAPSAASPFEAPLPHHAPAPHPSSPHAPQQLSGYAPSPQSGENESVVAAFFRGAGIDGASVEQPAQLMEEMGRAFRAMVTGLRRAMIARAEIKGEFRIDRTMIQPHGNNPLKFAIDDDDAIAALLGVGRRTGVSPSGAIADTMDDIRKHEIAVTRAMEAAAEELLRSNGPEAVLGRLAYEPGKPLSLLRRAKAWNAYVQSHGEVARSLEENMDGVFGRAFGRAYEAALRDIGASDQRVLRDAKDKRS
ncbi:type VI secretion system-associated FHA domain protein TagH [Acetobacter sp. DsW_063]|uniref:type VI secretion system-associated FHA domain protein TagH n=1 Tax=Acetobacter sp. DsW_063 TaxID=1514894 RepID=UPI000A3D12C5|nr:type VI secretion system-associated FHA domain protein TagH [Acetobacter sp. DsW_063]OUJ16192.1 hypothetical protein HK28_02955 [Acetobacter sp. DsW_063]